MFQRRQETGRSLALAPQRQRLSPQQLRDRFDGVQRGDKPGLGLPCLGGPGVDLHRHALLLHQYDGHDLAGDELDRLGRQRQRLADRRRGDSIMVGRP